MDNPNLLVFYRSDAQNSRNRVLVIANFNDQPQMLRVDFLRPHGFFQPDGMKDLCSCDHLPAGRRRHRAAGTVLLLAERVKGSAISTY